VFRVFFGCALLIGVISMPAAAEKVPGVTDREIKIGQTMPYTGPAAQFSASGLAEMAYLK
jgi:branched-chain amino acid transport system substrate-binding protein